MNKFGIIILTGLALIFSTQASAGDAAAGKAKAGACAGCHGPNGIATNPMYPNLAGQQAGYLAKSMKDYKTGARKDSMMQSFVATLSDADIDNIAAYYNSLK